MYTVIPFFALDEFRMSGVLTHDPDNHNPVTVEGRSMSIRLWTAVKSHDTSAESTKNDPSAAHRNAVIERLRH